MCQFSFVAGMTIKLEWSSMFYPRRNKSANILSINLLLGICEIKHIAMLHSFFVIVVKLFHPTFTIAYVPIIVITQILQSIELLLTN
jgi:hypothetical protein